MLCTVRTAVEVELYVQTNYLITFICMCNNHWNKHVIQYLSVIHILATWVPSAVSLNVNCDDVSGYCSITHVTLKILAKSYKITGSTLNQFIIKLISKFWRIQEV